MGDVDFKVFHIADGVTWQEGQQYIYQDTKLIRRDYLEVVEWNIDEEDDTIVNVKVKEIVSPETARMYPESVEPKLFSYCRIDKDGKDLVEMLEKGGI